jgi:multicomponent Na+:H+ antiporter subunit A
VQSCSVSSRCNRPRCCRSVAPQRQRSLRDETHAFAHDPIEAVLIVAEAQAVTNSGALLAATLAVPLAMLAACLSQRLRERMPALLAFAPLPAVAAALQEFHGTTLVLPRALLGLTFVLDRAGAMLLGASALLWIAAGAYAGSFLRGRSDGGRFAVWWLMTLTGSLGIFIAADLVSFYLFFTLVSLAAYGLVVFDNTSSAKRAGAVYVSLAVLGEAFLLMGFVLVAAASPTNSLLISDTAAGLATSPWRDATLAFLLLGFGLKIGLVPLHVWMPLAYTAAPIPAAAVLSGAAVKAGVVFIRFLPFEPAGPDWGVPLAAVGFFSAFYGVAIGITQSNPKTVLAYSSVSQMGLLAAVIGIGLAAGDRSVGTAAIFYAVHHTLVKGGLFLAVGVGTLTRPRGLWPVLLPASVLALGLGGLPLTGGALAKLVIKAPLGDGIAGTLATLSAIGSTVLMFHFLRRLMASAPRNSQMAAPMGLVVPWLAIAFAAVAVPWLLYPRIAGGSWHDAFVAKEFWAALWPVLVGGVLTLGLRRWEHLLPNVPAGDVVVLSNGAARAVRKLGAVMAGVDGWLSQWPVAGVALLALTIALVATLLAGH